MNTSLLFLRVTLALFPSLGTCPSCIVLLNMIDIGITSDGKIALINLGANLSGSGGLFIFKTFIIMLLETEYYQIISQDSELKILLLTNY
jgi:hypothetical protein